MKFNAAVPPREFSVGSAGITLKDCGQLALEADEQVTLVTPYGAEYDVARKSWGFYATPSVNGRLRRFGWKTALVRGADGRAYVMLVEEACESMFREYLGAEKHRLLCWLDDDAVLERIEHGMSAG